MHLFTLFTFVSTFIVYGASEGDTVNQDKKYVGFSRSGRKYDKPYKPQENYGDSADDADDDDDDSGFSSPPSPSKENRPAYGNLKGFDYGKNYSPYYKGYPYWNPYWKGSPKGKGSPDAIDESDMPPMDSLKMMEMMMMIDAMNKVQDLEKENSGLFPSLSSGSKGIFAAAVIPLVIIVAAVVPVLVNYAMTGVSAPVISSTATTNKTGRSIEGANMLDEILRNFEELARTVDTEDCIQKVVCQVASSNSTTIPPHIRKAVSTVANLVKEDWVNNASVKSLVKGLKGGNCENVCENFVATPRQKYERN